MSDVTAQPDRGPVWGHLDRLAPPLQRRVLAVFRRDDRGRSEHSGSAVLFRLGGRYYAVTAGHVFDRTDRVRSGWCSRRSGRLASWSPLSSAPGLAVAEPLIAQPTRRRLRTRLPGGSWMTRRAGRRISGVVTSAPQGVTVIYTRARPKRTYGAASSRDKPPAPCLRSPARSSAQAGFGCSPPARF